MRPMWAGDASVVGSWRCHDPVAIPNISFMPDRSLQGESQSTLPDGQPLLPIDRILRILEPLTWIIQYVLPMRLQISFVSDHMIIEAALPDCRICELGNSSYLAC